MKEKKLIDLYKKQLAQSSEKAPEGLWDDIAGKMDAADESQLISQYKEELANSAEKAPAGLWAGISKEMDGDQLISQYKEEVAQSAEKAPAGLWAGIARKLDVDQVWEGVAEELNKEKKTAGFWWFNRGVAAAIALLLISTLSVWFVSNLSSPEAELAVIETEQTAPAREALAEEPTEAPRPIRQPEFTIAITGSTDNEEAFQEIEKAIIASLQEQQEQEVTYREESAFPSGIQENILASAPFALNPLNASAASLAAIGEPSLQEMPTYLLVDEEMGYDLSLPGMDAGSSILALGFTTAMKNTWLFNHETFQGFDRGSGSRTHVKIYPDVAVSLRYLLSERWKMESSLSFSSTAGQSYEQYIYGRYSQREITLNYFHAEALAGYHHQKRWVVRSNVISHSSSAGLYYGVLNAASESIAGEKEDVSTLYRKNDHGIVAGHNLNIHLFGNLMFSPGMYITWGLPNIYQGEYTLPSLKRTHNRSVELRFSLYYNFSR